MNARLIAIVLAAVSAAVLIGATLATFTPLLLSVLLDTTPRTAFSTAAFLAQLGGLPTESLGFLALAGLAAVMGFVADRLH